MIIIIPARMESERLPSKPLLRINSKTLLQHTYERASKVPQATRVLVATDSQDICDEVCRFGGGVVFDDSVAYKNGTQRVAAAATIKGFDRDDYIVNWQVDEPMLEINDVSMMYENRNSIGAVDTMVSKLSGEYIEQMNRDMVKVAINPTNYCKWFSRQRISTWGHVGIYGYTMSTLQEIKRIPVSSNSNFESLEQISWLDFDFSIRAHQISGLPLSINNREDIEAFRSIIASIERLS